MGPSTPPPSTYPFQFVQMPAFHRISRIAVSSLGLIGLIGCMAAIAGVWVIRSHIGRTIEQVVASMDGAVSVVRERVNQTLLRVEESKLSAESVRQSLADWSNDAAGERLANRLAVVERTNRLETGLQQADHWVEVAESILDFARQALTIAATAGAPLDAASFDRVADQTAAVRAQLATASESVAALRACVAESGDDDPPDGPIHEAGRIALRVVTALGSVDERIARLETSLPAAQSALQRQKATALKWTLAACVLVTLLLIWMAAGQGALCACGWRRRDGS